MTENYIESIAKKLHIEHVGFTMEYIALEKLLAKTNNSRNRSVAMTKLQESFWFAYVDWIEYTSTIDKDVQHTKTVPVEQFKYDASKGPSDFPFPTQATATVSNNSTGKHSTVKPFYFEDSVEANAFIETTYWDVSKDIDALHTAYSHMCNASENANLKEDITNATGLIANDYGSVKQAALVTLNVQKVMLNDMLRSNGDMRKSAKQFHDNY
jgi:hypothetical protein